MSERASSPDWGAGPVPLGVMVGALLALASGCSIDVEHAGRYSCQDDPRCPPGFECIEGMCVIPTVDAAPAIEPPDAARQNESPDAAPTESDAAPEEDPTQVTSSQVQASSDDAEESTADATVSLGSSDLELTTSGSSGKQIVGIRFAGVEVPQGAVIEWAAIQFTTDEVSTGDATITFYGQAADAPATFTTELEDVSSRPRTEASVAWTPADWPTVGESGQDQRTPNLALVVQEIVNRPGWEPGSSMVFIATGLGTRTAEAYNGDPAAAPRLIIGYQ